MSQKQIAENVTYNVNSHVYSSPYKVTFYQHNNDTKVNTEMEKIMRIYSIILVNTASSTVIAETKVVAATKENAILKANLHPSLKDVDTDCVYIQVNELGHYTVPE